MLIRECIVCGSEQPHALVEHGTRLACNRCGVRSWPAEPASDTVIPVVPPAPTNPVLAALRTAANLAEALKARQREIAEERTGAIDPGVVPLPVLREEDVS